MAVNISASQFPAESVEATPESCGGDLRYHPKP